MEVDLLNCMGDDLTVVNAARVSYNKESNYLNEKDERLIHYLAEHNHFTPFTHPQLTFRVTAPIYVARQLMKHQVGLTVNEVSRRYVDEEPKFYVRDTYHSRPEKSKQGKGKELLWSPAIKEDIVKLLDNIADVYRQLIYDGVAPEQARCILPLNTYTSWYWTGSLYAFIRVCKLRLHPDAQEETGEIAEMIAKKLNVLFPISFKALMGN